VDQLFTKDRGATVSRPGIEGGRFADAALTRGETALKRGNTGERMIGRGVRPARPRMTGPVIPTLRGKAASG